MREHQRWLAFWGVIDSTPSEIPVEDPCLVNRYQNCRSYKDIEAVDREILGLAKGAELEDLVELRPTYRHKRLEIRNYPSTFSTLDAIGDRKGRMRCKRTYYEELFKWRRLHLVRLEEESGDDETNYTITASRDLTDAQRTLLIDLISEVQSRIDQINRSSKGGSTYPSD